MPMGTEKTLPDIAADVADELHDAVFDPAAWERMISLIGNWNPELRPLLHVETTAPAKVELAKFVGWDPEIIRVYADHYVDRNIFRPTIQRMNINEIGLSTRNLSEHDVLSSAFYTDILAKSGDTRSASGFILARNPGRYAVVGFHYPHAREDEFLPLGLQLQSMIAPLARQTFSLSLRSAARDNAQAGNAAIDSLAIPAMVLDHDGRIVRANELGAPLLSGDGVVRVTAKGHLEAASPHDSERLRASFDRMRSERRMILCPYRAANGEHVVAHFVPMRRSEPTDALISSFVGTIEPAAIVYFRREES